MATNVKAPKLIELDRLWRLQSEAQNLEPMRIVQPSSLSEMLVLIFGLMTLTWIIISLCGLT